MCNVETDETGVDGHWTLSCVSAQLSALKFVFKMNLVHICLLNVKLRPHRVHIVKAYSLYTPALRSAYGVVYGLYTVPRNDFIPYIGRNELSSLSYSECSSVIWTVSAISLIKCHKHGFIYCMSLFYVCRCLFFNHPQLSPF